MRAEGSAPTTLAPRAASARASCPKPLATSRMRRPGPAPARRSVRSVIWAKRYSLSRVAPVGTTSRMSRSRSTTRMAPEASEARSEPEAKRIDRACGAPREPQAGRRRGRLPGPRAKACMLSRRWRMCRHRRASPCPARWCRPGRRPSTASRPSASSTSPSSSSRCSTSRASSSRRSCCRATSARPSSRRCG